MTVQASGHLVEGEKTLVLRIVSRVAGNAAPLLLKGLVRHLNSCQLLANLHMAFEAEIRQLLLEQLGNRRPVGIVAGGARAILYRRMDNPRFLQRFGKIRVAFKTQIPDSAFEEVLFRCLMGSMAFNAGPNCNGSVHELLLERGTVMTLYAEVCPVLAHVLQKPAGGSVRLVACKAVTLLYRRMHHLLLPKRIVAL